MTERQQRINKYTQNLELGISAKYNLMLLRKETEPASKSMIENELRRIIQETGNEELPKMVEDAKINKDAKIIIGSQIKKEEKESSKREFGAGLEEKTSYDTKFVKDISSLQYASALKHYEKLKKSSERYQKYYTQRMRAYFILEDYNMAYHLACKDGNLIYRFIMAVASGHIDEAGLIAQKLDIETQFLRHEQSSVISYFGIIQLIMIVSLATSPATSVIDMYRKIINVYPDYVLPNIAQIVTSFDSHDYKDAIQNVMKIKDCLLDSIYAAPVADLLVDRILRMSIINFIFPCSRINISTLANDINLPLEQVLPHVKNAIRSGILIGKIDLETNEYYRYDSNYNQVVNIYDRLLVVDRKMDNSLWLKSVSSQITEP